jgi:hypothetical protein
MTETSELAAIVGDDNVLAGQNILQEYSKDLSFVPPIRLGGVVKPGK